VDAWDEPIVERHWRHAVKGILAAFVLASASGCGLILREGLGQHVTGSGVSKTQVREATDFDRVVSKGSADVQIEFGSPASIEVTADDNVIDKVTTEVSGSTLTIGTEGSFSTRVGLRVKVRTPRLLEVSVQGSGNVFAGPINSSTFETTLSGSGNVVVEGSAQDVQATVNGSGDINLKGLKATSARALINGSGDIVTNASEKVRGEIRGSGEISYFGNPRSVERSIHGSGSIAAGE
jgi:hypothetical protein